MDRLQATAQADLLGEFQRAVHGSYGIAGNDANAACSLSLNAKGLGTQPWFELGNGDFERRLLADDLIARRFESLFKIANTKDMHGIVRVIGDCDRLSCLTDTDQTQRRQEQGDETQQGKVLSLHGSTSPI